jgi:glycosyltransferase involved in cell wall biosynthesis
LPPKTQNELLAAWQNPGRCVVSVCMLAYNHEPYVRDALEGVLGQQTDFAFEALVHDDASTDRTADVIREYADRYPLVVKPIYQTVNQLSRGVKVSVEFNFPRIAGDFVAICECDDYWTDPRKLAKQVAAMRQRPECGLCFHPARQIDCSASPGPDKIIGRYRTGPGILPPEDVLLRRAGSIPTASCLVARKEFDEYVRFRRQHPHMTGDVAMQFLAARRNGACYLDDAMSVYRWFSQSSWTRGYRSTAAAAAAHEMSMIRTYRDIDAFTRGEHSGCIRRILLTRLFWYAQQILSDQPERHARFRRQARACLDSAFRERLARPGRWLVYGTGLGAQLAIECIPPDRVRAILDQDPAKQGTQFLGHPVLSPSALSDFSDAFVVVALPGRADAIAEDLARRFNLPRSQFFSMDGPLLPWVDDFAHTLA